MENDQDRWEYEVQRHQERSEMKEKIIDGLCWAFSAIVLVGIFLGGLAA